MSGGLDELNAMTSKDAQGAFLRCCGSQAWARRMAALRPFAHEKDVYSAALREWGALGREDWLEAFEHHPRIGERSMERAGATADWAKQEQAGAASASRETFRLLEEGNRAYEQKFGHVYLVCASGKTAEQMLAILESRLGNDATTELRIAAEQQSEITRLRLERLLKQ